MRILIINGPNLNLLGKREPEIYGSDTFEDFLSKMKSLYPDVVFEYFQSNIEGELINVLQANGFKKSSPELAGIIFNPGGYSHTSVAIMDAIASIEIPVIEVHISNVHAREDFRQHMLTARKSHGVISGFGMQSYAMAIDYLMNQKS